MMASPSLLCPITSFHDLQQKHDVSFRKGKLGEEGNPKKDLKETREKLPHGSFSFVLFKAVGTMTMVGLDKGVLMGIPFLEPNCF